MSLAGKPPKLSIVNLANAQVLEAQFNPTELDEQVSAVWSKLTVPGLSHTVKQFSHTEDVKVSFTAYWLVGDGGAQDRRDLFRARRFLRALCHPRPAAGGFRTAGAPRLLFVWPSFFSMTSVLTSVSFNYQRFNLFGHPVAMTAQCTLEEVRDYIVTMDEVLADDSPAGRNVETLGGS